MNGISFKREREREIQAYIKECTGRKTDVRNGKGKKYKFWLTDRLSIEYCLFWPCMDNLKITWKVNKWFTEILYLLDSLEIGQKRTHPKKSFLDFNIFLCFVHCDGLMWGLEHMIIYHGCWLVDPSPKIKWTEQVNHCTELAQARKQHFWYIAVKKKRVEATFYGRAAMDKGFVPVPKSRSLLGSKGNFLYFIFFLLGI